MSLNLVKDINLQIRKPSGLQIGKNNKQAMPRNTIVTLLKIKENEKIVKISR